MEFIMTSFDYGDTLLALSSATATSAPRLLVIDDDIVHRGIIGKVGDRAGFSITQAASFDEAARLLQKERFDCITLDLSLGRNYGLEIIHLLADIDCKTPVIVISGAGQSVAKLAIAVGRMKRLNICEPVSKPIDFALLKGILAQIKGDFGHQGAQRTP
jgi:two-component system, chemotaxis family, chemotaxis protein CheY